MTASEFWSGKRILITGHTGFKGSWLSLWLQNLKAELWGYSLPEQDQPSLFRTARVGDGMQSVAGDVRNPDQLSQVLSAARPEIVFHLAAQSLVSEGYSDPVSTYSTNILGTVNVLEAVRNSPGVRSVIVVTSDKCYANMERPRPYTEADALGGRDPYSSSKACAEIVTAAYRDSYFANGTCIASARAGNAIGGGDWARNRLVPDIVRALARGEPALIRNPDSVRPWQHVLEPLSGYLVLAQAMQVDREAGESWNFASAEPEMKPVSWIADQIVRIWSDDASWRPAREDGPHEAQLLQLDSTKARTRLGWRPRLTLAAALDWTVEWYRAHYRGGDVNRICLDQIGRFQGMVPA